AGHVLLADAYASLTRLIGGVTGSHAGHGAARGRQLAPAASAFSGVTAMLKLASARPMRRPVQDERDAVLAEREVLQVKPAHRIEGESEANPGDDRAQRKDEQRN